MKHIQLSLVLLVCTILSTTTMNRPVEDQNNGDTAQADGKTEVLRFTCLGSSNNMQKLLANIDSLHRNSNRTDLTKSSASQTLAQDTAKQ